LSTPRQLPLAFDVHVRAVQDDPQAAQAQHRIAEKSNLGPWRIPIDGGP
jgi:hypothetical protein